MTLTLILQSFPPANAINTGLAILLSVCAFLKFLCAYFCGILYQAVKDVGASYDALVDLLESLEHF